MDSNSRSLRNAWSTLKEAVKGGERDYTQIPLNQAIVFLAIPMVLEMVGESLFAVVDFFFVSQVGEAAMATVGLTESVMFLIYSLSIGLANAATAMVARRIGEKEPEQASIAAAQAILISLVISIMIAIPGFLFAGNVLEMMGAEADVLETGTGYTRIMFATNGVIMFLFLLNGVFRGTGNAAIAMRVLWLSNIINMVLDPCLILGLGPFPELGVEGAAIATSIGRGTGVLFQLYLLFGGKKSIKLKASDFVPRWDIIKRLLKVASGGTGQYLISSASWIFLTRIVAEFGTSVMAGYQSAIRSIIFAILPAFGLSNACATLVGQSLGADQPDRAEKAAWRSSFYAMIYMVIVSILFFFGADWVINLFAESQEALDAGITCLRIISSGYIFFGFGLVLSMAFNGAGDTRTPTLINFLAFWIVQIPLAYFLASSLDMKQTGVYVAILIAEVVFTAICIIWFRQGKWKKTMI
ncbi:MAG: MATE family efflux transporter [Bacteroidota bacterium]